MGQRRDRVHGQDAAFGDLNLAKSDVMVAEATIGDAKAQQQQESATLDFHTLMAPYDAMVTARQICGRRAGMER